MVFVVSRCVLKLNSGAIWLGVVIIRFTVKDKLRLIFIQLTNLIGFSRRRHSAFVNFPSKGYSKKVSVKYCMSFEIQKNKKRKVISYKNNLIAR